MRKGLWIVLALAVGIFMISTAAFAAPSGLVNGQLNGGTGITGTFHDLSSTTGVGGQWVGNTTSTGTNNRICIFCHAPHNTKGPNSGTGYTYLPLWNHELSTVSTYQTFSTGTAQVGSPDANDPNNTTDGIKLQANIGQPGAVSKLCLSCHDGSVAVSAYGMNAADSYLHSPDGTAGTKMTGTSNGIKQIGAGGDLSNHHPIGFNYNDAQSKDQEIAQSTTTLSSASGVRVKDVLIDGKMECITCHDVHNSKNESGAEKFLWKSDTHSRFCLTCHLKGAIN
ncbi:MAG: hypothetical protein HQL08_14590 [Nitrospirae bacterium]|nr:hypothetical protein [Nitrospirota bacterium]